MQAECVRFLPDDSIKFLIDHPEFKTKVGKWPSVNKSLRNYGFEKSEDDGTVWRHDTVCLSWDNVTLFLK